MKSKRGLVFISCGQVTPEEKKLGQAICDLVEKLTPHAAYFADKQSNFEGVTKNILASLDDAIALIAVMHHRGRVIFPDDSEYNRASVWVEQEIAIAAYMAQILGREIKVAAYIQEGIRLEGLREKILLNPICFGANSEVLIHLEHVLPNWRDLSPVQKVFGPAKLRFGLERGDATNCLFKFANEEDEKIFIREIVLKFDDIELTEPLRPDSFQAWIISPNSSPLIQKGIIHQKNPAAVLSELSADKQMWFREKIEVAVTYEFREEISRATRFQSVRVNRINSSLDAIY